MIRYPFVTYAARSDMGRVRRNNEDNLFCCGHFMFEEACNLPFKLNGQVSVPAVFAVCDGMGGYQLGEKASLIAAQILLEFSGKILDSSVHQLDWLMQEYISAVNQQIKQTSISQSSKMGTTLALIVVLCHEIRAYNIGDSRIYTFDRNGLHQISVDHTLAMTKVKSGLLTEAQARQSNEWNKLTACLGFPDNNGNDYKCEVLPPIRLNSNIRLLLCSDGLTDVLTDNQIEWILNSNKNTEQATLNLMSEALNHGGTDNVTAIVVDVTCSRFSRFVHASKNTK